jgi:hypothetical protein
VISLVFKKRRGNYALMAERVHMLLPSYIEQEKDGKILPKRKKP